MTAPHKIAWQEGIMLLPQHFQQQEYYFETMLDKYFQKIINHFWGIEKIKISEKMLQTGYIEITQCIAIFSNGTYYDSVEKDLLPDPIIINKTHNKNIIYLAIPFEQAEQYQIINENIKDYMNSTINHNEKIKVKKLKPKLIANTAPPNGYYAIPLIAINNINHNNSITLEKNYPMPILNINNFISIKKMCIYVSNVLQQYLEKLTKQSDHIKTESQIFNQKQTILPISDAISTINHQLSLTHAHPENIFLAISKLYYQLHLLHKKTNIRSELLAYKHINFQGQLENIINEIIAIIHSNKDTTINEIRFKKDENEIWNCELINYKKNKEIIIAIKFSSNMSDTKFDLNNFLLITPKTIIQKHVQNSIPGIKLMPVLTLPHEIPFYANHLYYKLDINQHYENMLLQQPLLSLQFPGFFKKISALLWILEEKQQ